MELKGFKGISAWMVYNKVVFSLPLIWENCTAKRNFSEMLSDGIGLSSVKDLQAFIASLAIEPAPNYREPRHCLEDFKLMNDEYRRVVLTECLTFTSLSDDEVLRLMAVHKDANGMPYTKVNLGNLSTKEFMEKLLDTLVACSNINADTSLITQDQFDTLDGSRVDIRSEAADILSQSPSMEVGDLIGLSAKKALKGVNDGRS